jgi:hypothetical protein
MPWLKKNPFFAAIVLASAAACAAQGWLIHTTRQRGLVAAAQLEAKRQERDWLARQTPTLDEVTAEAIGADVAAAERRLDEVRTAVAGKGWLPPAPPSPVDAYFALATFTERMRALAGRGEVAVGAAEGFGFSTYANEGPQPDLVAAVHRQRVVMQHVLETLFEAHPKSLVACARERPLTEPQRAARRAGATGTAMPTSDATPTAGQPTDFFTPDARLHLQAPGLVEGELYRVEFLGQTQTLRAFLNALATSPLPLFVRAVEVEPGSAESAAMADRAPVPPGTTSAVVPLVAQNYSKFGVVIECVEVASEPPVSSP